MNNDYGAKGQNMKNLAKNCSYGIFGLFFLLILASIIKTVKDIIYFRDLHKNPTRKPPFLHKNKIFDLSVIMEL